MVTHTGLKLFTCTICNKSFTQSGSLLTHMRKHADFNYCKILEKKSEDQTHLCPICGKVFGQTFSLTIHIRRHLGDKPYKCDTCEMK